MEIITGDLIKLANEGEFTSIVHGCNCFSTMGAGIAKAIKLTWPRAYQADARCRLKPEQRLGKISSAMVEAEKTGEDFRVINAYTQYRWGRGKRQVDYSAVRACFKLINSQFGGPGTVIGFPLIGCGLAGGDWNIISRIIDDELGDTLHYLVKLN